MSFSGNLGLGHFRNRILWTVQWTNYFCILWMNFMYVISLLLLKRQIAHHIFFCCTQSSHTKLWNTVKLNQRFAAEKETHRGGKHWFPVGFITMYKEVGRTRKELALIWYLLWTRYVELSKVKFFNPHNTCVGHSHSYLTARFTVVKWCV